jgi:ribulose-5-phosphate 4-epimerase/fuculose-1-phosphate aldolase
VALRDNEKPRLVADLGRKNYLMLRNHGLLTLGRTIADAFQAMYLFETTCAIQVRAQSGGGELIPVAREIIDSAKEQARQVANGRGPEQLIWPGLLRRLDRIDQTYRT